MAIVSKFGLADYIAALDLKDPEGLARRQAEILMTVRRVMEPYLLGEHGRERARYYRLSVARVEDAAALGRPDLLGLSLEMLKSRIDME